MVAYFANGVVQWMLSLVGERETEHKGEGEEERGNEGQGQCLRPKLFIPASWVKGLAIWTG